MPRAFLDAIESHLQNHSGFTSVTRAESSVEAERSSLVNSFTPIGQARVGFTDVDEIRDRPDRKGVIGKIDGSPPVALFGGGNHHVQRAVGAFQFQPGATTLAGLIHAAGRFSSKPSLPRSRASAKSVSISA